MVINNIKVTNMLKIIILIILITISTGCSLLEEEKEKKEVVHEINNKDFVDPYLKEDGTIEEVINIK